MLEKSICACIDEGMRNGPAIRFFRAIRSLHPTLGKPTEKQRCSRSALWIYCGAPFFVKNRRSARERWSLAQATGMGFRRKLWTARSSPRFAEGGSLLPRRGVPQGERAGPPPRGQVRSGRKAQTSLSSPKLAALAKRSSIFIKPDAQQSAAPRIVELFLRSIFKEPGAELDFSYSVPATAFPDLTPPVRSPLQSS